MNNKFNEQYYKIIFENGFLFEDQILLEGKIKDLFNTIKNKFSSLFKNKNIDQSVSNLISTQLDLVKTKHELTPDQTQKIETIQSLLPMENKEYDYNELYEPLKFNQFSDVLTEIDRELLKIFGSWWKDHFIDREESKLLLMNFRKKYKGKGGIKLAMPSKVFGNAYTRKT